MGKVIPWICTKCGKTTASSENPKTNNTNYGKCPKGGEHSWKKK